jgi:3-dehydroquinate synthase
MTPDRLDIDFAAAFRHRLRFTDDVLGEDLPVLWDVLAPTDQAVRAVVLVDSGLANGSPQVMQRAGAIADRCERVRFAAPPRRVDGGEASKNDPAAVDRMLGWFRDAGLDRRNYVIAIGGGAMLDAVGFAAAIAHRGLRLVRLPTTTSSQADSGVGVKNGVNRFGQKNWMGAFAVPWAVINDRSLRARLPDRDFRCGFAEAVKVALVKDAGWFDQLQRQAEAIARRDPAASDAAIRRSAHLHLMHITRGGDPFEMLEARPLDFGHWSAHRLEAMTRFQLRHGEAVAIGVALDCVYSAKVHGLPDADAARVIRTLQRLGLPVWDEAAADTDALLAGLEEFRQHLGGRLTLTMLAGIGQPIDVHAIDHHAMHAAIRELQQYAAEAVTTPT